MDDRRKDEHRRRALAQEHRGEVVEDSGTPIDPKIFSEKGWTLLPKGLIWYWMTKAASGTDALFCTESLIADMERKFGIKLQGDNDQVVS